MAHGPRTGPRFAHDEIGSEVQIKANHGRVEFVDNLRAVIERSGPQFRRRFEQVQKAIAAIVARAQLTTKGLKNKEERVSQLSFLKSILTPT